MTAFTQAVHGVGITPVTPFSDYLSRIDEAAFADNLTFLAEARAGLLHPCGNTGEFTSRPSPTEISFGLSKSGRGVSHSKNSGLGTDLPTMCLL